MTHEFIYLGREFNTVENVQKMFRKCIEVYNFSLRNLFFKRLVFMPEIMVDSEFDQVDAE